MKLPAFVHADDPDTYTSGNGLMTLAEYSRTLTVTCEVCKHTQLPLKLLSNTPLSQRACDRLLTEHLDGLGWGRLRKGGADICPTCMYTRTEVCTYCRQHGGGHARSCVTLIPGFNGW